MRLTAILVTALGIGATTAALGPPSFVFLRPLPYARPDRLVTVWAPHAGIPASSCRRRTSAT